MLRHNGTARGIDYAERYQDAQVLQAADERREERRERFLTPRIESPELDAVRDRMNELLRREAAISEWTGRLIRLKESWLGGEWDVPEVTISLDRMIGATIEKRKALRAEWEAVGVEFRKLQG